MSISFFLIAHSYARTVGAKGAKTRKGREGPVASGGPVLFALFRVFAPFALSRQVFVRELNGPAREGGTGRDAQQSWEAASEDGCTRSQRCYNCACAVPTWKTCRR